jgi:Protein of unknown function (DUF3761)
MSIKLSLILLAALGVGTLTCGAQAPAGSTGLCKDGTYTTAAKKRGSCDAHGGVKAWFGAPIPQAAPLSPGISAPVPAPARPPVAPPVAATSALPQTVVASPQVPTSAPPSGAPPKQVQTPAASVKVWVNLSSKVYHCSDSEWYGKTQSGKYMTQADAIALGARPAYSKPCSR